MINKYFICFFTKQEGSNIKKYTRAVESSSKRGALDKLNKQLIKEKLLTVSSFIEEEKGIMPDVIGIKYINNMNIENNNNGEQKSYSRELLREDDSDGIKEDEEIWEECVHHT